MTLKVGGSDPLRGPVGGIHWHTSVSNRVDYLATDKARQTIPWVRMTDAQGVVTVYRVAGFTNAVGASQVRTMDCIDCHNRPSHRFMSPDGAVDLALSLGQIDRSLPWIKTNVVYALTRKYHTDAEAREGIATVLAERYPNDPRIQRAIPVVQRIYADNFFPEMKSDWRAYPDNLGHLMWSGCFRCHDGNHKSADGKVITDSCNACHVILSQGNGPELQQLTPDGQPFNHPGATWAATIPATSVTTERCSGCRTALTMKPKPGWRKISSARCRLGRRPLSGWIGHVSCPHHSCRHKDKAATVRHPANPFRLGRCFAAPPPER